jgi:dephospho-CoA kinase
MARSAMAETEVRAIMAAQLPRAERLAHADDIIDNSGAPELVIREVARLDHCYRELAKVAVHPLPAAK